MALSGSTDYSLDRDTLIAASLRLCGVGSIDEDPTADDISQAAIALNIMVKAWQADGLQLWQVREYSLTPVDGQAQYSLGIATVGSRPLQIVNAQYKNTSTEVEIDIHKVSREEFDSLSTKSQEGTPNQFYFDPQLTNSLITFWPVPDTTFSTDYTIELDYMKPFDDLDTGTDDFEFPSEWYEAIKYGLAIRLAPEYGMPIIERQQLIREAMAIKEAVMLAGQEQVSVFFSPRKRY